MAQKPNNGNGDYGAAFLCLCVIVGIIVWALVRSVGH